MKNPRFVSWRQCAAYLLPVFAAATLAAAPRPGGVPNFQTVNDHIYRGGQPSDSGFRNLSSMGIKTVLDLRESGERSKDEKRIVKALGMKYVSVPMKGMTTPTDKQVSHALKVLNDPSAAPVFVHCKRGADRTGVVLACYRIQHDDWDNSRALSEARSLGMSWYQFPLQKYVMSYHGDHGGGGFLSGAEELGDSIRDRAESIIDSVRK